MVMWTTTHCFDFFLHVILCILSQCVQNYRPTHEQTNILLDQLQNTFFSHITCTGGGGVLLLKLFAYYDISSIIKL